MDTKAIEMLYTQPGDTSVDNRGVSGYMTRTTRAGRQLDIDVYPIIKNRDVQRAMRTEAHRGAAGGAGAGECARGSGGWRGC